MKLANYETKIKIACSVLSGCRQGPEDGPAVGEGVLHLGKRMPLPYDGSGRSPFVMQVHVEPPPGWGTNGDDFYCEYHR
jgi:hypothetical protein